MSGKLILMRGSHKSLFCCHTKECFCSATEFWVLKDLTTGGLISLASKQDKFCTVLRMFLHENTDKFLELIDSSSPEDKFLLSTMEDALTRDAEELTRQTRFSVQDETPGLPLRESLAIISTLSKNFLVEK